MKTTLKYVLMTATFMTCVAVVSSSAKADPSVMCSVRANYQGSVDAHGKAVVPADVQAAAPSAMPRSVRIPLSVDMAQRMNEVLPAGMKLEPQVGTIEILNDGHVIINGKDMTAPADALCATVAKQKEAALKTKDAPKKKKEKKRAADVPANINEPAVEHPAEQAVAIPAVSVVAEPAPPVEPSAPEVQMVNPPEVIREVPPQVLSAPSEPQMQQPAPVVTDGSVQPPSDGTLSGGTDGMLPRPPSEGEEAMPPSADQEVLQAPSPQGGDGMLSGGAQ